MSATTGSSHGVLAHLPCTEVIIGIEDEGVEWIAFLKSESWSAMGGEKNATIAELQDMVIIDAIPSWLRNLYRIAPCFALIPGTFHKDIALSL
jgi:hypothetical protein